MKWDWSAVSDFMPHFWDGLLVTLQILVLGSLISFALGLVWALLMRVPTRWVTCRSVSQGPWWLPSCSTCPGDGATCSTRARSPEPALVKQVT